MQVIGSCVLSPSLLDPNNSKYFFDPDDFIIESHRVIFCAIYELVNGGAKHLNLHDIDSWFSNKPVEQGIYVRAKGAELIKDMMDNADISNFDIYYNRVKKMTILRVYQAKGIDVSWIYDPSLKNTSEREKFSKQSHELEKMTLTQLNEKILSPLQEIEERYIDGITRESVRADTGLDDLLDRLSQTPEIGVPFGDGIFNNITRGMRLGKFYLRSAPTGNGKTRIALGDVCYAACLEMFDPESQEWVQIHDRVNPPRRVLFISTELDMDEIQTMMLACVTGINEQKILRRQVDFSCELVQHGLEVIHNAPIYIEVIPDFNIKDIENSIRRNHRQNRVEFVFFDYVNTCLKLLTQIGSQSKIANMREDQVLYLLSSRLKEIAVDEQVFIMSATQTNSSWKVDSRPDAALLKGSKAVAEKIDFGCIILPLGPDDKEFADKLESSGYVRPNKKISVYKNRQGEYTMCYLWIVADMGTCRYKTVAVTDWEYNQIDVPELVFNDGV